MKVIGFATTMLIVIAVIGSLKLFIFQSYLNIQILCFLLTLTFRQSGWMHNHERNAHIPCSIFGLRFIVYCLVISYSNRICKIKNVKKFKISRNRKVSVVSFGAILSQLALPFNRNCRRQLKRSYRRLQYNLIKISIYLYPFTAAINGSIGTIIDALHSDSRAHLPGWLQIHWVQWKSTGTIREGVQRARYVPPRPVIQQKFIPHWNGFVYGEWTHHLIVSARRIFLFFGGDFNICFSHLSRCLGTVYAKVLKGSQDALQFRMGGKLSDEDSIKFFEEVGQCPIPKYVLRYAFKPISHSVFYESKPFDGNGIDSDYPNDLMADK